jgi:hypothetical protein
MSTDKSQNAEQSTVTQLLRRLAGEPVLRHDGVLATRAEALAMYLWDIAIDRETTLPNGVVVKVTNDQWFEVMYRLVERMDGKAMTQISAEVNTGVTLVRNARSVGSRGFDQAIMNAVADPQQTTTGLIIEAAND